MAEAAMVHGGSVQTDTDTRERHIPHEGGAVHAFMGARTIRLAAACARLRLSDKRLGQMLGVTRTIARELRIGKRPVTSDRIEAMPSRLRAAFDEGVQLALPGMVLR